MALQTANIENSSEPVVYKSITKTHFLYLMFLENPR